MAGLHARDLRSAFHRRGGEGEGVRHALLSGTNARERRHARCETAGGAESVCESCGRGGNSGAGYEGDV